MLLFFLPRLPCRSSAECIQIFGEQLVVDLEKGHVVAEGEDDDGVPPVAGVQRRVARLLQKGLRELKNRCRYNQSGLIPQAQREREQLLTRLEALEAEKERKSGEESRLSELRARLGALSGELLRARYIDRTRWDLPPAKMDDLPEINRSSPYAVSYTHLTLPTN